MESAAATTGNFQFGLPPAASSALTSPAFSFGTKTASAETSEPPAAPSQSFILAAAMNGLKFVAPDGATLDATFAALGVSVAPPGAVPWDAAVSATMRRR